MKVYVVRCHLESKVQLFHSYTAAMEFIADRAIQELQGRESYWQTYYKEDTDIDDRPVDLLACISEFRSIGDYKSIIDLFKRFIGSSDRNSCFDCYQSEVITKNNIN